MYVRCSSCEASFYEVVDALEGANIACVSCGARIAMTPLNGAKPDRDLWTIVTSEGLVLSFSTEADVVSAILSGAILPGDSLLGGDAPSTSVELVPELSNHFRLFPVEQTLPYGLDVPDNAGNAVEDTFEPIPSARSLEQALLEFAGDSVRHSAPSVFEPGLLDEPPMAVRRPSDRPLSSRRSE